MAQPLSNHSKKTPGHRPAQWLIMLLVTVAALEPGLPSAHAQAPLAYPPSGLYESGPASRDGIGKFYMGREISFVMGHRGVDWLERPEREIEERPDLVVDSLDLAPDAVVADIGAGSGYFTFRLSRLVPDGRVVAVDIQPEMLSVIETRGERLGVSNIELVLGTVTDPNLAPASIDSALLVDAYHEFSHPREMMEGLMRALEPGGRLFLVEYRGEDPEIPILPLHKMTVAQARLELEAVGFEFVDNLRHLPQQHLMIFRKPEIQPLTTGG